MSSARDELAALLEDRHNDHHWPYSTLTNHWIEEHGPAVLALIDAATRAQFMVRIDWQDERDTRDALMAALAHLTGGHR